MDLTIAAGLVVAILGGAAIGLERQWSGHATGLLARFGGIRTFTMLGTLGGLAGWFVAAGPLAVAVVLLASAAALVVAGYVAASRVDVDGTTEVAALIVLASGTLAGAGQLTVASGVIAGTALLLVEKTRLHALVARIDDAALRASARFAALACVILPLLPAGPYGPADIIRPRELWALVLFFSGLSFLGWIARRLVGAHHGAIVSGLLGGLVSSTSVTFTFARQSRSVDAPRLALAIGVIGACTIMLVRVEVAAAVLNPPLAGALLRYIGGPFIVGLGIVLAAWLADGSTPTPTASPDSPLKLRAALQMTALFQLVLVLIVFVKTRWGSEALVATSAIVGLTDLDALTLSLARGAAASNDIPVAAVALVAGMLSNTLLKLTVAAVVGRGSFRAAAAGGLGAMATILAVSLLAAM
jgi:uncharacterized membrane protein (DUF4010 family)